MEQQTSPVNENIFDLQIDEQARKLLLSISKTARFIAIVSLAAVGLSIITSLVSVSDYVSSNALVSAAVKGGSLAGGLLTGLVQVLLNVFLYRFATNTINALKADDQLSFNKGAGYLKLYFKMIGILIIIAVSIIILAFIFAIIMGIAGVK